MLAANILAWHKMLGIMEVSRSVSRNRRVGFSYVLLILALFGMSLGKEAFSQSEFDDLFEDEHSDEEQQEIDRRFREWREEISNAYAINHFASELRSTSIENESVSVYGYRVLMMYFDPVTTSYNDPPCVFYFTDGLSDNGQNSDGWISLNEVGNVEAGYEYPFSPPDTDRQCIRRTTVGGRRTICGNHKITIRCLPDQKCIRFRWDNNDSRRTFLPVFGPAGYVEGRLGEQQAELTSNLADAVERQSELCRRMNIP
jgi:hypothetical protein